MTKNQQQPWVKDTSATNLPSDIHSNYFLILQNSFKRFARSSSGSSKRLNRFLNTFVTGNTLRQILHHLFFIFLFFLTLQQPCYSESFFAHYKLPPIERAPTKSLASQYLNQAKVLKRLKQLPVSLSDIDTPETYTNILRKNIKNKLPAWPLVASKQTFKGNKVSELNKFMTKYKNNLTVFEIIAQELQADETLVLNSNHFIDGNNVTILAHHLKPTLLIPPSTSRAGVTDITFSKPTHAIHIESANGISLSQLTIKQATLGITISGKSQFISLDQLNIINSQNSGLVVNDNSHHIWLHNSNISNGQSAKNEGAALFISDAIIPDLFISLVKHHPISTQPILFPQGQATPHHILIEYNTFKKNHAQGIYLDGGNGIVIRTNEISNNDKEGLCLDFGSANNIISENIFAANGNRAYQSDQDLEHDLVLGFGRMADGSAISKLPGIALDNAAQNFIIRNSILKNAGDGIKIVRSGFRNWIIFNSILDNNRGHNSHFHFFGILLGSAGAEPEVISDPEKPLDFFPPIENIIAGNIIYGQHYSAILIDKRAGFNDIYDNVARQFINMPLENASQSFNNTIGNSWNMEKRQETNIFHSLKRLLKP